VVNFTTVACKISSWLKWYKNYKNRLRLAKVIVKNKMSRCLWFTVYICLQCKQIAEIFRSPRKSGSRYTMVTSDLREEVEIWPFCARAMDLAIIYGTVRSLWSWLWGTADTTFHRTYFYSSSCDGGKTIGLYLQSHQIIKQQHRFVFHFKQKIIPLVTTLLQTSQVMQHNGAY